MKLPRWWYGDDPQVTQPNPELVAEQLRSQLAMSRESLHQAWTQMFRAQAEMGKVQRRLGRARLKIAAMHRELRALKQAPTEQQIPAADPTGEGQ